MDFEADSENSMVNFGKRLGSVLGGGELIELVGDVGAGKTTLVRAIASGMGISDDVSSPSYTLNRIYESPHGIRLGHYDFYRLSDPGILSKELEEALSDPAMAIVIEWGDIVSGVLPADHLKIQIVPLSIDSRQLKIASGGARSEELLRRLHDSAT